MIIFSLHCTAETSNCLGISRVNTGIQLLEQCNMGIHCLIEI